MPLIIPVTLLRTLVLCIALVWRGRTHLPSAKLHEVARRGIQATLRCSYQELDTPLAYRTLPRSRDGLAVAVLLRNAASKTNPARYADTVPLLRALVDASGRGDWWAERHDHPEATSDTGTVAIFVETTIGPILDLARVQICAHVSAKDAAAHVPDAPAANGRTWARVALQPRAAAIAAACSNNQKGS